VTPALVIDVTGAQERACTLEEFLAADEVFMASTVREVQPVVAVDQQSFDGAGAMTQRAATAVAERVRSELDG
jgi:branched-chain amino acid aminotransferase